MMDGDNDHKGLMNFISKEELDLLKKLKTTGKPVVFVVTCGGSIAINWCDENLDDILMGWYPDEEGV